MIRIAKTENGLVRGLPAADPRITSFKGIPFAAPPVGKNRWRAPQPAENWEGIRDAYAFANISVQDTPGLGTDVYCKEWHVDPEIPMGEDCLYLNIWTPAKSVDEKLPVLIWYFGGALQWGYPSEMEFDGERLARRGVIVVSVNYRIGVLGFLAHKELRESQPDGYANFGNLDQKAGLEWVIRNISQFGGDPNNITISGQSAGGGSVLSQLACKSNRGHFQRAVIFSGIIRSPYSDEDFIIPGELSAAEKNGDAFIRFLGANSIDEARELDALEIRDKYAQFRESHPWMGTCVDGVFLEDEPLNIVMRNEHVNVPIMAGNTADEFHFGIGASDEEALEKEARRIFGDKADKFLSLDESHRRDEMGIYAPASAIEAAVKATFARLAECKNGNHNYYYRFNPDIPGEDNPGTFHSVDLWFFFETLAKCWRPFKGRHYDLARQMCNYWVNFIKTGNPNGCDDDGSALPQWKPYSLDCPNEMEFTGDGSIGRIENSEFTHFLVEHIKGKYVKKQVFNPYLPSWEYVPDGEPYVFDGRVYVYGSHDKFGERVFCPGDYVTWSAPIDNLKDWRCDGVIYRRNDDPLNTEGKACLYAPDMTVGPDGRYYLYYVLDKEPVISVAVCDTPSGRFKYYGNVHYEDGTLLGLREGDEPQFDPGVLTENGKTYLFSGFCGRGDKSRTGSKVVNLAEDMLTIVKEPQLVVPGSEYSVGTEFEGHAFFEASSIRKRDNIYYFIYSSEVMHELCYAYSDKPDCDFKYGGVIVSNCDMHIDTYKPADMPAAYGANNHGSIVEINGQWYIFYHRQTNNSWYARQGCAERIYFDERGQIKQVELTSSGLNGEPLDDKSVYPAYIACNLFKEKDPSPYVGKAEAARIKQDIITDITDGTTIGFKYFDCKAVSGMRITTSGYANGTFEVRCNLDGEVLGRVTLDYSNVWVDYDFDCHIPDGVNAIFLTYVGDGSCAFKKFQLLHYNSI